MPAIHPAQHLESKPEQFRRSVERLGMMDSDLDRVCFAAELLAHVQPMPIYRKKVQEDFIYQNPDVLSGCSVWFIIKGTKICLTISTFP